MANNDATAAINIIFDTPSFKKTEIRRNGDASDRSSSAKVEARVENSKRSGNEASDSDLNGVHQKPRIRGGAKCKVRWTVAQL